MHEVHHLKNGLKTQLFYYLKQFDIFLDYDLF